MASPKTKRKRKQSTPKKSTGRLTPQRRREILGVVLMALSLLLALAVITYHAADDTEIAGAGLADVFDPDDNRAQNALGLVGAWLANALVPGLVGYPVLLLVGLLAVWGFVFFRPKARSPFLTIYTAAGLAGMVLLACFIGWFGVVLDTEVLTWSGAVGTGVATWLAGVFGRTGAFILLLLASALGLLLALDHDIQLTLDRFEDAFFRIRDSLGDAFSSWRTGHDERVAERQRLREERRQARADYRAEQQARRRGTAPPAPVAKSAPPAVARPARPTPASAAPPEPASPPPQLQGQQRFEWTDDTPPSTAPEPRTPTPMPKQEAGEPSFHIREAEKPKEVNFDEKHVALAGAHDFLPPSVDLLDPDEQDTAVDYEEIELNKQILLDKLDMYNITITNIDAVVGPTITLYELDPAPGVKLSKITALEDDLAMATAARGIRILAPIPGKSLVGVEIPNRHRELVRIRPMLNTQSFRDTKAALPVPIGKTIEGDVFVEDLAKMPHLLIAGATGSGKSVGLNALIAGLLYACPPEDLKFVMIDPKKIELQQYNRLKDHFIAMPPGATDPVITDFAQALGTLKSCEKEMEARYDLLSNASVRGIKDYNKKIRDGKLLAADGHTHMPYIVVIIDELADLMMTAGKDIEAPIARLAQMARAVGIHLVLATQRPSVDVITGLIKANFPARMAYQVASKIDSRTILDQGGAEQLVGNGDLLYMNGSRMIRLQGPFVSLEEVERLTDFIGDQAGSGPYPLPEWEEKTETFGNTDLSSDDIDDLFEEAAKVIVRSQQGSVSLLQRKLSVGYTRAARIVDQLEEAGIVGPFEGSKARQVLVEDEQQLDALLNP